MKLVFKEDFKTSKGKEPGNWFVEMNSDLPFSAYQCDGKNISLLSPGNRVNVRIGPVKVAFNTTEKPLEGFAALARGAMYCLADVYDFETYADIADPEPESIKKYHVAFPNEPVMNLITCDIRLKLGLEESAVLILK